MFPKTEYSLAYTKRDKTILEFIIKSVIREYDQQLKPFSLFANQVKVIKISPTAAHSCGPTAGGCYIFDRDEIELQIPPQLSMWELTLYSRRISHEIAHHTIEAYFADQLGIKRKLSVNLVHHADNLLNSPYVFSRRYGGPLFWKRYGFPYCHLQLHNLRKLIDERDYILANLVVGKNTYV